LNGHKFIDLGLSSKLLWAETNIGAETAYDDGNYYAWGETVAKSNYLWGTYNYGASSSNLTKYNGSDGKAVLELKDDAAYVNWGGCRMPTKEEFDELNNCTWTWTSKTVSDGSTSSTIYGYEVTSKADGNNNSIFLPASGYRGGDNLCDHGSYGYYWSSTLLTDDISLAYDLYFNGGYHSVYYGYFRYYGHSVRPVAEP